MASLALKEWAVIVRALLTGEQLLDLRKGGLHEQEHHFELRARRFWLYPTTEHERPELLKPAYRRWLASEEPDESMLCISGWAEVAGAATIDDDDSLDALTSKVIWTHDYAASRLRWKRRQPLTVLALRAHRLVEPVTIPLEPEYVGCSSWVELDGLPDDPAEVPSEPALSDESFTARLELIGDGAPFDFDSPARN